MGWPMPIDNTNHFYQYQQVKSLSSVYVLVGSLWVSQGRLITNVVGKGSHYEGKAFFYSKQSISKSDKVEE